MQGNYKLMMGDTHVGTFTIDRENDVWIYEAGHSHEEQPLVFKLLLRDQSEKKLSGEAVRDWIIGRAPEPNYEFIDALMEKVGISKYDPLAFVEYNGGRFNKDSYYLIK